MPSKPAPLVGVTGGIGSGKSTVCLCFERLGRVVMSANLIARDLTETNAGVRRAIVQNAGQTCLECRTLKQACQRAAQPLVAYRIPERLGELLSLSGIRV